MCGLKKRNNLGDLILPIAAIRGEGTSNDYFPAEVPALPALLSKAGFHHHQGLWRGLLTGTVYTTTAAYGSMTRFLKNILKIRAYAIDMETATIFTVGFYNKIPTGALLLVSDQPMIPEGVKTEESDRNVTATYVERHLKIGIDSLKQLINDGLTVRHLKF
jgi:AMP nucleosidase